MKKSILFVDDEPSVLDGLRRMLYPMRHEWDMAFVTSGQGAMNLMAERPFEVIVSDIRMPGMDGAELLTKVRQKHPQLVRIVLSGHSAKETVLRLVGSAHQYLSKPCDAETLKSTISRAVTLRDLLGNESLKQLISQMKSLPSLPSLYAEVIEEVRNPNGSIKKVGEIISKDVGMTAKVLQLVNSAFFGLSRHVSSPVQAAGLLGFETLQSLVLAVNVFSQFDRAKSHTFCIESFWRHSMETGTAAKQIAAAENASEQVAADALMAALLHDAGKLMLAQEAAEPYQEALALADSKGIPHWEAEQEILGATHAEAGAYLLGLWGLPDPIVEAVAYHHCPSHTMCNSLIPLTAVHVANALVHERTAGEDDGGVSRLDLDYLSQIGLVDRLPAWRDRYDKIAEQGGKE